MRPLGSPSHSSRFNIGPSPHAPARNHDLRRKTAMKLKLYMHPLSSYCHKALIALYENDVAFEPVMVEGSTIEELRKLWPVGKFPVLLDERRGHVVPESTIIIEYLDLHYPGKVKLIPTDPERAREVRM